MSNYCKDCIGGCGMYVAGITKCLSFEPKEKKMKCKECGKEVKSYSFKFSQKELNIMIDCLSHNLSHEDITGGEFNETKEIFQKINRGILSEDFT